MPGGMEADRAVGGSSSTTDAFSRSREVAVQASVLAQIPVMAWIRPSAMALTKVL